uniref:Uncharacterized protein n=1 Tax=Brassica campestris TaxID=3711 RepID=M4D394_BRACM
MKECEEEESYWESPEPAHSVPLRRLCRLTVALSQNASSPIGDLRRFLRRSLPLCFPLQLISLVVLVRNLLESTIDECG